MVKIHKREGGYMVGQECNTAVQMPHANFVSRLLYLPRGISRLEKLGQRKVFPKNHMLVQAGTKPNYCYIVKTGRVAAFETTVTGEERIYNFNESNSVLLEGNLLFDQESAVNFDEFMLPTVVDKNGMIHENDSVIFFNFRPDRARQLTRAFVDPEFTGFERRNGYFPLTFVCMAQYDAEMPNVLVAFPPEELKMTFGEYLAKHGKKQLRLAETQKYAHVTFFFNGGEEKQFEGEDRILVNSPKVATFDMQPEMSAYEVCDNLVESIRSDKYDVIIVNFANPDMVGHTGIMEAAIKAIEVVDECVGKTVDAILDVDGQMFICADHGNAEKLLDEDGEPFTAHTTNPVPFVLVNYDEDYTLREGGCLADIVPTMIEMMGMEQPAEMTGKSLLIKK